MYIVTRKITLPKMFRNVKFMTYNEARAAVRKWIRNTKEYKEQKEFWRSATGNTPDLWTFNFSIKQV